MNTFEKQHIDRFRNHFRGRGSKIPPGYDDETGMFLRYLQAEKFTYEKGATAIFEHYEWLLNTFPM